MQEIDQILKVFLCHSSGDKETVREIWKKLNSEVWVDAWLDEEKILPGQDWNREIELAVEKTDVVIVFLSSRSVNKDGYVQKELRFVLNIADEKTEGSIFVIPLRLDDCVVPIKLRGWQRVDYFPDSKKILGYQLLLRSLKTRFETVSTSVKSEKLIEKSKKNNESSYKEPNEEVVIHTPVKNNWSIWAISSFFAISIFVLISWVLFNNLNPIPSATPTFQQTSVPKFMVEVTNTSIVETPIGITPDVNLNEIGKDGMLLISVPASEFIMGSKGNDIDERPVHTVYLGDYYIDQTEVTNAMYAMCVDKGKCQEPRQNTSITQNGSNSSFYYGNPKYANYPVIYTSWNDAKAYCMFVGRRLPTEAEWEKAASWDDVKDEKRIYPWGNSIDCSYANFYGGENKTLCVEDTSPVGSYPNGASFYGALDMAGNVWEWVLDRYDSEYYGKSPDADPQGPLSGNFIVIRGGSFLIGSDNGIRSSDREKLPPDNTSHNVGFRCAMDATP